MTRCLSQMNWCLLVLGFLVIGTVLGMDELDRIQEYVKRYGDSEKWPPKFVPDTPGWTKLMNRRFHQIRELEDRQEKYDAWISAVTMAYVAPNFTEYGFGLARAPEELTAALQEGIRGGLERGEARLEHEIQVIEGPQCLFIDRPDLTRRVIKELQPFTETWAGLKLRPAIAYGFRLYQNSSVLNMHVDKSQTHIISMIYHIDRSEDSEPWPIYIEGFDGNLHEVELTPGDILFYESSKCLHGRPKVYNGSWYTSIFIHYYPLEGWMQTNHEMEGHFGIPAGWDVTPEVKTATPLAIRGTSYKEPTCPNKWCQTENTVKFSGPAEEGYWIDAKHEKHPFNPQLIDRDEEL